MGGKKKTTEIKGLAEPPSDLPTLAIQLPLKIEREKERTMVGVLLRIKGERKGGKERWGKEKAKDCGDM